MSHGKPISNLERSEDFGLLQEMVDALYDDTEFVSRMNVVSYAKASEYPDDLIEIVELLQPGEYFRQELCDQLNSAIAGHAWGQVYGTVE